MQFRIKNALQSTKEIEFKKPAADIQYVYLDVEPLEEPENHVGWHVAYEIHTERHERHLWPAHEQQRLATVLVGEWREYDGAENCSHTMDRYEDDFRVPFAYQLPLEA